MYSSKIWRTRLDATTNWAVVTTGIAMSVTFSAADATPLPIVLISFLVTVFWVLEARRYRLYDVWRTRVRVLEANFYGPLLRGQGARADQPWSQILADDYTGVYFHINYFEALGRRLRRNYAWIFAVQVVSYWGKLAIHPVPLTSIEELWTRAAVGPVPGHIVLALGTCFILASWCWRSPRCAGNARSAGRMRSRLERTGCGCSRRPRCISARMTRGMGWPGERLCLRAEWGHYDWVVTAQEGQGMPGHLLYAICEHCAYQSGTLSVGAGNDRQLYVAAFDPSKREIVTVDRETAQRDGMVIYSDPYLDNAVNVMLKNEPYRRGPSAACKCPLCGVNDLRFDRIGFWD